MKLAMEEKERELKTLRSQLQEATDELNQLKEREGLLESKVHQLLGRLDGLPTTGSSTPKAPLPPTDVSADVAPVAASAAVATPSLTTEDDDEIILLDEDESEFQAEEVLEKTPASASFEKEELIVESEDEVPTVEIDEDDDIIIDDEDEAISVFDADDDDDFLIIEDDPK
ncbi:Conserved hypothetical protein [Leptospira biflexa serovar Patoc strain 'Patoc 1 (Paris)']|uniref:Uncharacterized protein n=2 Tax=Leptospira biflexa TaxID=172 RepID=B0SKZ3_LEPBP|nr:Conserved hypothetical protein [Leptospira biflexa serovar Patoc strain 'Patoc 1 (Paris)']